MTHAVRIKLDWNGTNVLDGTATRVCAYDTVRAFFVDQFAGLPIKEFLDGVSFGAFSDALVAKGRFEAVFTDGDMGQARAQVSNL